MLVKKVESLSRDERKRLNKEFLDFGHGFYQAVARACGIHHQTASRIHKNGEGSARAVNLIREKILSSAKAAVVVLLFLSLSSCVLTGKRMFTDEGRPMPGGKTIRQGMNPQAHIVPSRVRHYRPINSIK